MKQLILKFLLLCLAVCMTPLLICLCIAPQYTHSYNAAFIDKIDRLERQPSPKIILVGDSNLAFGIDSALLEKQMGFPVVNLGLHGGLGNAFHERMALFNTNAGDIVVICHLTYADDDIIPDPELALLCVENNFHLWKVFRPQDYPRVLRAIPNYTNHCVQKFIKRADTESEDSCYTRSAFNEYGDNIFPRTQAGGETAPVLWHPSVNETCMKRINAFAASCREKGAQLVIAGAPILSGLQDFSPDEYRTFQEELEALAECPVISNYSDYVFDKSYFFMGALHMTNEGAVLRTQQLARDLKAYLAKQS